MIPIDKLRAVKTIIVHDNCSDGTASAILLKDAYSQAGLEVELRFIQYGTEAYKTLTPSPNMLFCDFSPDVPEMEVDGKKILDPVKLKVWKDSDCLILDHHKSAKDLVAALGPERCEFADEKADPGIAGAVLAFRHVWLPLTAVRAEVHEVNMARDLAHIVGIRDTWQRADRRWQTSCEMNEVLRFFPNEDWLSRPTPFRVDTKAWWDERIALGMMLWAKHCKSVQKAIEKSWRFTTEKGTRAIVFEGVRLSSDVAEALDKEVDLVMAFDYEAEAPKTGGTPIRKIILLYQKPCRLRL